MTNHPGATLHGSGTLRRRYLPDARPAYGGHLVIGGRTTTLSAEVSEDERGRFFTIEATLDPDSLAGAELDRLIPWPGDGPMTGTPVRKPVGPIIDDPIPL